MKKVQRKFNRLINSLNEGKQLAKFEFVNMVKSTKTHKIKPQNHIHLYVRKDLTPKWKQIQDPIKNKPYLVFVCQKPACSNYVPIKLALGKICECNICHNPMILDKETVIKAKPRCIDCIVRKVKPDVDRLMDLIKDI